MTRQRKKPEKPQKPKPKPVKLKPLHNEQPQTRKQLLAKTPNQQVLLDASALVFPKIYLQFFKVESLFKASIS